jgi:hypothetical protein
MCLGPTTPIVSGDLARSVGFSGRKKVCLKAVHLNEVVLSEDNQTRSNSKLCRRHQPMTALNRHVVIVAINNANLRTTAYEHLSLHVFDFLVACRVHETKRCYGLCHLVGLSMEGGG